ncbi:TetR family transcriptional regulator [Streptomyces camponoticapitis]|uniref:TetR family transcriptional regulator n=1 Tax=Streptomyces camponoticapitis TaxID=1616125 RepID=A0ABQ2ELD8_9ACTN|nr:TetR family transcriptional regulator [Streptomyces camponoticapitis]GGK15518.1 TetR family transcriptional regulator [Streptomyces camponoticapitis]
MAASASPPPDDEQPRLGLRERKKLKTRVAIREATYRLIAEQGYEATTVEQIAAAAEVSPSTVFRYFPTKEDIVLTDEFDPVMEAEIRARPADEPPLESVRAVLRHAVETILVDDPEEFAQRSKLMLEIPAVRARMTETMAETSLMLSRAVASRTGRQESDLEVLVFTASVLAALREVTIYWAGHGQKDDLAVLIDRALDSLKGGLAL